MLATTVLAGSLMMGASIEASAEPYAAGGDFAAYTIPTVRCDFKTFGTTTSLVSTAAGPAVLARNYRSGTRNDAAWARYRIFLVDMVTGRTTAHSGWSGFAYATDVSWARWAGTTTLSHPAFGNAHRVVYQIEWYHSAARTAWVADRVTQYQYYDRFQRHSRVTSC